MRKIQIINIECNTWNGFMFDLLSIETASFEGALLGIWVTSDRLSFDVCFFTIEIKSPFN